MKRFLAVFWAAFLLPAAFCQPNQEEAAQVRFFIEQKPRQAQALDGRDGSKGLLFYGQNSYQILWLMPKAQDALANSAQKYQAQFQKKALKRSKSASTSRAYGSARVFLEWGPNRQSLDRSAPAKASFGYVFQNGSPYFCVSLPAAKSRSAPQSPALQKSQPVRLLFTRAQLQSALCALCPRP